MRSLDRAIAALTITFLSFLQPVLAQNADSAQNVAPAPGYEAIAAGLGAQVEHELEEKRLPAMAIALVDTRHGGLVWAQGFGYADEARTQKATAHSIFRVGSVSKLFTDVAVMQMVEQGRMRLDAPIEAYIPELKPRNPFGTDITLRTMMAHRSGLLREPPVGHYFDPTGPSLKDTVLSLNETTLEYKPGTDVRYSNAAITAVGYALERVTGEEFSRRLKTSVLAPLGMEESAFTAEAALQPRMAQGRMWSYDGLDYAAPTFALGTAPAGSMYTSVTDLAKFAAMICAKGQTASGQTLLKPETVESMMTPQFTAKPGEPSFGLGFVVASLNGHKAVGHGGAVYGFATEMDILPEDGLGVVVVSALDATNAVTSHLARRALEVMLAAQQNQQPAAAIESVGVSRERALKLAGTYTHDQESVSLSEQESHVILKDNSGETELRQQKGSEEGTMISDSRLAWSPEQIKANGSTLTLKGAHYTRVPTPLPAEVKPEWRELIGEYGWDYDKLFVLEDKGSLNVLIEWFEFNRLEPTENNYSYKMPDTGMYKGETVEFVRDGKGAVTGVKVGAVLFERRALPAEDEVFQLERPLKPVGLLRQEALQATPPKEAGEFREPDLVELNVLDPTIHLDIRYATSRNFLKAPLYLEPRAYMQRPAAEAVTRASQELHKLGYGLLIHDSYRPWYVTKMFWEGTPDDKKIFVANPDKGSRHNRGCAVDLTLYDLKTGKPLVMTGGYDEMSERSYPFYPGGTARQRWQRDLLRRLMEDQGFTVYEFEWWHFDYKDWSKYPVLNLTFEQLRAAGR